MKSKHIIIIVLLVALVGGVYYFSNEKMNQDEKKEIIYTEETAIKYLEDFAKGLNGKEPEKSTLEDIEVTKIDSGVVQGFHFKPKEYNGKEAIITFGGSSGNVDLMHSKLLASEGFDVYALYYFGQDNQTLILRNVEISMFEDMLKYIKSENSAVKKVNIVGFSRGTEFALLIAKYYPSDVSNVALFAPSAYMWPSYGADDEPAWAYKGESLPYLDSLKYWTKEHRKQFEEDRSAGKPSIMKWYFIDTLDNTPNLNDYLILKEPIDVNIIAFAGDDDMMWPAARMAKEIKGDVDLHIYENVGHSLLWPTEDSMYVYGGDNMSNFKAFLDSKEKLVEFFSK